MTSTNARFALLALYAALAATITGPLAAQTYPSRSITMVVPFAAGSGLDTVARIVTERMQTSLGQGIVIENALGASGSLGTARVARAEPDGYTLVFGGWVTHVVIGATFKLQFDVVSDFTPIAKTSALPWLVAVRSTIPSTTLPEYIAWMKAKSEGATLGTVGPGSAPQIVGSWFAESTGAPITPVPYRGIPQITQDVLTGQIDMMFAERASTLPHYRSGKLKVLAVLSPARLPELPDVPTAVEAGVPGFTFESWQGMWAPKNTPKHVVERLNASVVEALADSQVRQRLAGAGATIPPTAEQTPEHLGRFQKAEIDKWWPMIKRFAATKK